MSIIKIVALIVFGIGVVVVIGVIAWLVLGDDNYDTEE